MSRSRFREDLRCLRATLKLGMDLKDKYGLFGCCVGPELEAFRSEVDRQAEHLADRLETEVLTVSLLFESLTSLFLCIRRKEEGCEMAFIHRDLLERIKNSMNVREYVYY
ncbi:hypothetical protein HOP50_17g79250 [Chloropicon primus]|uniref:Uncharacterized protein n=1 Tax=Chloropicon primus TaxID=1764295 RepID=A0A5B8N0G1_9CHLO|nr:hypothetical protein A3770_17p79030 [Chloropicon primus]UPR04583.1 hypothetical protein HOP50_17g79250 [Chloropicon primus]|mmetsp:Transcript_14549/g.41484  ORF Transcript_14549/g.41484 Transcript_14549/m.41484 type:complete len:110 (-) Transcript_14549:2218-2547(-)|eukprot:QDZ25385.1 hypothetical protein A3770_17p79030 [Chloropicon primus]